MLAIAWEEINDILISPIIQSPLINKKEDLSFKEIKELKFNNLSDILLLEYQKNIIESIKNEMYINDKIDNIDKLYWIKEVSLYFSNKINLPIYMHNNSLIKQIHRSSYKFCNYNYECQFNYNKHNKGCYAQHYVHNLVYADVDSILNYLKNTVIDINEVKKSIGTLAFVITHMHDELKNAIYFNGEIEKNIHIEKTLLKRRGRKN